VWNAFLDWCFRAVTRLLTSETRDEGVGAAAVRQNGRATPAHGGVVVTSPAGMRPSSAMVMAVRRLRHRMSYRLVQTVLFANLSDSPGSSGRRCVTCLRETLQTSLSGIIW
jgi:hypothetical protein